MRNRAILFFVILAILSWQTISSAQQLDFSVRDELMLMAIEQLSEQQQFLGSEIFSDSREEAISSAINRLEGSKQALNEPIDEGMAPKRQTTKKMTPGVGLVNSYLNKITSRLHPYLSAQATLNDNVNALSKKRSSLGYVTNAGIRGSYATRGIRSINLDVFMNNNYHERNAAGNTQSLTVNSQFNLGFKRSTLSIANSYFTNYIASKDFGIKTDQLKNYWSDTLGLSWGKHFNRIGFDIGSAHSETSYEGEFKVQDSFSDSFAIGQYLFIGKKSRLSLDYSYKRNKNRRAPEFDSRLDTFGLELAGVVSPKITGAFTVDYAMSDLKSGIDSRTKTFGLDFAYRISNRSNLALDLSHAVFNDAAGDNSYFTEDAFSLSGKHRLAFNPRLSLSFSSSVKYRDYPKIEGSHNDYVRCGVGLGLGYAFRQWLDLSLSWEHSRSYSNMDTDYNQNIVQFISTARF